FVGKPVDVDELVLRTLNYARIAAYEEYLTDINVILESKISEATGELSEALALATAAETEIAYRMGRTAEFRDLETGFHIRRMSRYSAVLAELHGLPRVECDLILNAAPLHDIGKVGIPDKILLKPGRLTAAEYETMKLHATIGEEMLDDCEGFPLLEAGRIIAAQHHEKYDGGGYPRGLAGDDIHIYGRIVAVADVFDALSSRRVYKDAMPIERVAKLMKDEKGKHFDPVLVDLLLDNLDRFLAIRAEYPDDEDKTPSILELIGEKI
ncbi:HD domain-containing protein, partial [bacterium]|nr:HD domain-containing protein [bacterium]